MQKNSEGILVGLNILVTFYSMSGTCVPALVYATNPTVLKNKLAWHCLMCLSHFDSFLISVCIWILMQHLLFVGTNKPPTG